MRTMNALTVILHTNGMHIPEVVFKSIDVEEEFERQENAVW